MVCFETAWNEEESANFLLKFVGNNGFDGLGFIDEECTQVYDYVQDYGEECRQDSETDKQEAVTDFYVELNGKNSSTHVISRSIAKDRSKQKFSSNIQGNTKCFAHVECDAIIMDKAKVVAIPRIDANNIDANLIHEAAIGKIAGEQLIKLMSLGLSEKQAEQEIINGFLK